MPATQLQQNAAAFLLLAGMTFLEADEEEPLIQALRLAPYNQVADFLDGTARTGKSVPHAERWWEQTGRYLSSAQFKTAFRCRRVRLTAVLGRICTTSWAKILHVGMHYFVMKGW